MGISAALAGGTVCAAGTSAEVLTRETVQTVFGLDSVIADDPVSGTPLMVPIGRHRTKPPISPR